MQDKKWKNYHISDKLEAHWIQFFRKRREKNYVKLIIIFFFSYKRERK